jgi:hypothetical protein
MIKAQRLQLSRRLIRDKAFNAGSDLLVDYSALVLVKHIYTQNLYK